MALKAVELKNFLSGRFAELLVEECYKRDHWTVERTGAESSLRMQWNRGKNKSQFVPDDCCKKFDYIRPDFFVSKEERKTYVEVKYLGKSPSQQKLQPKLKDECERTAAWSRKNKKPVLCIGVYFDRGALKAIHCSLDDRGEWKTGNGDPLQCALSAEKTWAPVFTEALEAVRQFAEELGFKNPKHGNLKSQHRN